jgi:hypothetical protein
VSGLPPGDYRAVAVDGLPGDRTGAWASPEVLGALLPVANTVSLARGERLAIDLRLGGGR